MDLGSAFAMCVLGAPLLPALRPLLPVLARSLPTQAHPSSCASWTPRKLGLLPAALTPPKPDLLSQSLILVLLPPAESRWWTAVDLSGMETTSQPGFAQLGRCSVWTTTLNVSARSQAAYYGAASYRPAARPPTGSPRAVLASFPIEGSF
eukprot:295913-Chlamydomonas_euryale.AAC.5